MTRTVRGFCPIIGRPDTIEPAFADDPARWLPSARRQADDSFQIVVRAGALSRHVRVQIGSVWRRSSTMWRNLQWEPVAEDGESGTLDRWLPSLTGELGLNRRGSSGSLTMILDGTYEPPGGFVGAAFDVAVLGRVAQSTVDRFLADAAAGLTAESMLVNPGRGVTTNGSASASAGALNTAERHP